MADHPEKWQAAERRKTAFSWEFPQNSTQTRRKSAERRENAQTDAQKRDITRNRPKDGETLRPPAVYSMKKRVLLSKQDIT